MTSSTGEIAVSFTAEEARHVRAAVLLQAAVATSNATNERQDRTSQQRWDARELLLLGIVAKLDAARRAAVAPVAPVAPGAPGAQAAPGAPGAAAGSGGGG
jgi:hypothetical protein